MKQMLSVIALVVAAAAGNAAEYDTPPCYATMPVTCGYDEMTLDLCNQEGKKSGVVFLGSQRMHLTGGNRFGSADGQRVCEVRHIKDTDPARYTVTITE